MIWSHAQSFHKKITGPPQKNRTHDELSRQNTAPKIFGAKNKKYSGANANR
jgi:hypothetical protein